MHMLRFSLLLLYLSLKLLIWRAYAEPADDGKETFSYSLRPVSVDSSKMRAPNSVPMTFDVPNAVPVSEQSFLHRNAKLENIRKRYPRSLSFGFGLPSLFENSDDNSLFKYSRNSNVDVNVPNFIKKSGIKDIGDTIRNGATALHRRIADFGKAIQNDPLTTISDGGKRIAGLSKAANFDQLLHAPESLQNLLNWQKTGEQLLDSNTLSNRIDEIKRNVPVKSISENGKEDLLRSKFNSLFENYGKGIGEQKDNPLLKTLNNSIRENYENATKTSNGDLLLGQLNSLVKDIENQKYNPSESKLNSVESLSNRMNGFTDKLSKSAPRNVYLNVPVNIAGMQGMQLNRADPFQLTKMPDLSDVLEKIPPPPSESRFGKKHVNKFLLFRSPVTRHTSSENSDNMDTNKSTEDKKGDGEFEIEKSILPVKKTVLVLRSPVINTKDEMNLNELGGKNKIHKEEQRDSSHIVKVNLPAGKTETEQFSPEQNIEKFKRNLGSLLSKSTSKHQIDSDIRTGGRSKDLIVSKEQLVMRSDDTLLKNFTPGIKTNQTVVKPNFIPFITDETNAFPNGTLKQGIFNDTDKGNSSHNIIFRSRMDKLLGLRNARKDFQRKFLIDFYSDLYLPARVNQHRDFLGKIKRKLHKNKVSSGKDYRKTSVESEESSANSIEIDIRELPKKLVNIKSTKNQKESPIQRVLVDGLNKKAEHTEESETPGIETRALQSNKKKLEKRVVVQVNDLNLSDEKEGEKSDEESNADYVVHIPLKSKMVVAGKYVKPENSEDSNLFSKTSDKLIITDGKDQVSNTTDNKKELVKQDEGTEIDVTDKIVANESSPYDVLEKPVNMHDSANPEASIESVKLITSFEKSSRIQTTTHIPLTTSMEMEPKEIEIAALISPDGDEKKLIDTENSSNYFKVAETFEETGTNTPNVDKVINKNIISRVESGMQKENNDIDSILEGNLSKIPANSNQQASKLLNNTNENDSISHEIRKEIHQPRLVLEKQTIPPQENFHIITTRNEEPKVINEKSQKTDKQQQHFPFKPLSNSLETRSIVLNESCILPQLKSQLEDLEPNDSNKYDLDDILRQIINYASQMLDMKERKQIPNISNQMKSLLHVLKSRVTLLKSGLQVHLFESVLGDDLAFGCSKNSIDQRQDMEICSLKSGIRELGQEIMKNQESIKNREVIVNHSSTKEAV